MRHRLPLLTELSGAAGAATRAARVALVAGVALLGCAPTAAPSADRTAASTSHEAPRVLPPAPLVALDGSPADLGAAIQGRTAVVSLWATWCEACLEEAGALLRLDAQTTARGDAVVVGIAVGEPHATVAAFAREHGLTYARFVDEDFRLADALGQPRLPATLVIDRRGNIVHRGGALDAAALAAFRGALGDAAAH
jgi:peroxiredoxin